MEWTLLWAALTAGVLAWLGLRLWNERVPDDGFDRVLTGALIGLVGGRLTAVLSQGVNPLANPGDFIVLRGGVHTGMATLGFLIYLVWSSRGRPEPVDALAPAVLLGVAGWHGGCLWRGACLGTQSDLPWAWALESSDISRHPVELYAAIGLVLGAFAVARLGWKPWARSGVALAIAGGSRLITEPLRPSITGGPVYWYLVAIVLGLAAVAVGPKLRHVRAHSPT